MELIVINERKLKIMLSGEDMVKYHLEEDSVDSGTPHAREVFRRIFDDARAAVGFETLGERLLVQYYVAGGGGGCEIFVTKLGSGDFSPSVDCEKALLRRVYACEEEVTGGLEYCFSFPRSEDLLAVCRRLRGVGYEGESRVYIAEGTREIWYLFLEIPWAIGSRLPKRLAFLREYGESVDEEWGAVYLGEHGRLICGERAVEVLGGM
jgi:negative regulator of genetic competence, sporulation and motility